MIKMKKAAVLFNPTACKGQALKKRAPLEKALNSHGIDYDLFLTQSREHLIQLALKLSSSHSPIIAAGGDSSLTIIADALLKNQVSVPLAMIGIGSSNDISMEFDTAGLDNACSAIKRGKIRNIDAGAVFSKGRLLFHFIGHANIGLGAHIARDVERLGRKLPSLSRRQTLAGALAALNAIRTGTVPADLTVKTEEETLWRGQMMLVSFSNIRYWASGRILNPASRPDDGLLEASFLSVCSFPRLVQLLQVAGKGALEAEKEIQFSQGTKFHAVSNCPFPIQADGEILGGIDKPDLFHDLDIRIIPGAVDLIS